MNGSYIDQKLDTLYRAEKEAEARRLCLVSQQEAPRRFSLRRYLPLLLAVLVMLT